LAIEDQNFLKHPGVSWRGFARAALNNLTGGPRQGGSTITQQLVKNDILTPERTLERKAKELIMAIILEHKLSKDEILEKYLNIIYFGQNGPYQVRGLGAAAQFYFDQELKTLNLAQCSLLAAILNSPGLFDPERKAEAALKRRNLVLQKMRELNWINDSEQKEALAEPAPKRTSRTLAFQNFQYFIEAAVQSRASDNKGADINLSLQSPVQNQLQKIMNEKLPEVQLKARELSKKKDLKIEAAVVVVDLHFGQVVAATGGQQFLKSPFNRLIHARRPIGSIIKPFVYHYLFSENKDLDAQSEMQDEPFTYKFSGQQWTPENYNNKHLGQVPLFYAFKESLNTPLVKMVAENNFNGVFTHLQSFGFAHKDNPSVVLGAIELSPWEVAKVYFQLLNRDQQISEPSFELQTHSIRQFEPYSPETAMVINLMQNVVQSGTAKSAGGVSWQSEVAGKTGTTSDYKDSWFVGYSERYLTVVWVGSDQNVKTGLTGASGALPIWLGVQKYLDQITKPLAFTFPDTVEKKQIEDTFANQEITILKRD
jgi:penicillin-binding protein 1B